MSIRTFVLSTSLVMCGCATTSSEKPVNSEELTTIVAVVREVKLEEIHVWNEGSPGHTIENYNDLDVEIAEPSALVGLRMKIRTYVQGPIIYDHLKGKKICFSIPSDQVRDSVIFLPVEAIQIEGEGHQPVEAAATVAPRWQPRLNSDDGR